MNSPASHVGELEKRGLNPNSFVRTLVGDIPADESLGVCAAHEHVVITGPWIRTHFPEFELHDLERILIDLQEFRRVGGGWIVDSMPTGAGRDAALLAEVSRMSGVPIICPTGVHQAKYYPPDHALCFLNRDQLVQMFRREITVGINDGVGTLALRAGVIKVASNGPQLSERDREIFSAAAIVQQELGCPILTHTEASHDAHEQLVCLSEHGANLEQVVLSHCDKNIDLIYLRDLLQSGVNLEFDQHFRQLRRGEPCASVDLIVKLIGEFPSQLLVGMDLARQCYWKGFGGSPGLAWLVTDVVPRLRTAGLSDVQLNRLLVTNPIHTYSFCPTGHTQT